MFQIRKMMFIAGALSAGVIFSAPAQAAIQTTYCAECEAASLRAELPLTTTAAQLVSSVQAATAQASPANRYPVPLTAQQMEDQGLDATPYQMNPYWVAQSNSAAQASATFGSTFFNGYTGQVNMANLCNFWSANIPQYSDVFSSCASGADAASGLPMATTAAPTYAPLFPDKIPDSTDVDTNISLSI